jgi:hypothetical protein
MLFVVYQNRYPPKDTENGDIERIASAWRPLEE